MKATGTVQRVYTGRHRVVFMTGGVGEVHPGQEFTVAEELAPRFDGRADIAEPRRKRRPTPATPSTPASSAQDGDQDGDQDDTTDPGSRAE